MPKEKRPQRRSAARPAHRPAPLGTALDEMQHRPPTAFPNVPVRWLLSALAAVLAGAVACGWAALCFLFWQGNWQLLYHPQRAITLTPANVGLQFEPVRFWATESGETRLTGWWIPSAEARFTVLFLQTGDGDLSDRVNALAAVHRLGVNVFAIDYRGYGQSADGKPSEEELLEDAGQAMQYLEQSRHLAASSIVLYGEGLGATVAAELAGRSGARPAGVVLSDPLSDPMQRVFADPRSRAVPAHWFVRDRYDLAAAASGLAAPSLWLIPRGGGRADEPPAAYKLVGAPKMSVVLQPPVSADVNFVPEAGRWLDELAPAVQRRP